jgi:hypothetical protein
MSLVVKEKEWNFITDGPQIVAAYNSASHSPYVKRLTGSATIALAAGGISIALDATNEAQIAPFYFNDLLQFDIDDVLQFEFMMSQSVALGSNARWFAGLASAYNAAPDSLTAMIGFISAGSSAVLVESDDGTNDNDDKATGETLATVKKRFKIDLQNGLGYHTPPTRGVGGKGNIQFYMSKGQDLALAPVGRAQRFNAENYTAGLQPYFQLLKASSTDVGSLLLEWAKITYRARV